MENSKSIELPNNDFTLESVDPDILEFWDKENRLLELEKGLLKLN